MYTPAIFNEKARFAPIFEDARNRARLGKVKSILGGRSHHLMELEELMRDATIISQHHLGTKTVCLNCIKGSAGRNMDFDREFNPLKNNNRDRWINVATARLQDIGLPAVDLIQVGDIYFVRDGHHRISVAKALGADYIDAKVTVLEIRQ